MSIEEIREKLKRDEKACSLMVDRMDLFHAVQRFDEVSKNRDDLADVAKALLEWIDAVPSDTELPTMPGVDRDWVEVALNQVKGDIPMTDQTRREGMSYTDEEDVSESEFVYLIDALTRLVNDGRRCDLAQGEWVFLRSGLDRLRARLDELEGKEPVAWRYCEGRMKPWSFTDFPGRAELKRKEGADVVPLYTAPPAAVPEGWTNTDDALPEMGVPCIGQNDDWIDGQFNEHGVRECFTYDDGEQWQTAKWCNYHDCYHTTTSDVPTKWRYMAAAPQPNNDEGETQ